jgi:hypothetical protein
VEAQAKAHFEKGHRLSDERRYLEAEKEFAAGYQLTKKPLFLFNMGECARMGGNATDARKNYEQYLAEDPHGKLAETARQRLAQLPAERRETPQTAPVAAPAPPPPTKTVAVSEPAPPAAESRADLVSSSTQEPEKKPLWKRPGLWIGVGAAVVVIAVAGGVGGWAASRGADGCSGSCVDLRH